MLPEMKLALIRGHLFGLLHLVEEDSHEQCVIDGYRYNPRSTKQTLQTLRQYIDDVMAVAEW